MSVTIRDVMKLPCMKNAEVVAGKTGLDNPVTAVSVLEYSSYSDEQEKLFSELNYEGSDITITAFSFLAGDNDKILNEIKNSYATGEAGVIIYYFDLFTKKLEQRVIDYADDVGYPIIVMPRDQFQLRYSEAISEIQGLIIDDQLKNENFDIEIMETFVSLPKNQQNVSTIMKLLSNYLHRTFIATESDGSIAAFAGWPMILEREAEDILRSIREGEYEDSYEVIKLEGMTGKAMSLVVAGNTKINAHTLDKIRDVMRLYLKMSANETAETYSSLQLIRAIIGDEPAKMRKLARNQGIDAEKLTNMIIYREPHFPLSNNETILRDCRELLDRFCKNYVMDNYSGDVVIFLDNGISANWLAVLMDLTDGLRNKGLLPICVYARNLRDPSEVREAYLDVTANLEDARNLYRKADIFSYHEILYVKHIKEMISGGQETVRKEMDAMKYIRTGTESDKELIDTLVSFYFDSYLSVSKTAENLFVHVNTVKYRLKRISESLGCRVTDMPEMMELYKALALYRLMH